MLHSFRWSSLLVVPLLFVVAVSGASAGSRDNAAAAPVKTAAAHILVNANGMTLYIFSKDTKGKSNCSAGCAKIWPPLTLAAGSTVPPKMTGVPGTFGEIMLAGGAAQLTYDGAPLYTFVNDKKPGDINGQGVAGVWWAVVVPGAM